MIPVSILVLFVSSILFNVILPTGDVYSDVGLMVKTLRFDLGDAIELSGCRSCYGKDEDDLILEENEACPVCVEHRKGYFCGDSPFTLSKMLDLQSSQSCANQNWRVNYYKKDGVTEVKVEKGECMEGDFCCMNKKPKMEHRKTSPDVDMRAYISVYDIDCDTHSDYTCDVLVGNASLDFCNKFFDSLNAREQLYNMTRNIKTQFEEHFFNVRTINEKQILFSKGFEFEGGCGVYLRPLSMGRQPYRRRCGVDACLFHMQDIKNQESMTGIRDLNGWKTSSNYTYGGRVGGKNCKMLQIYGWAMAFPLVLSVLFNIIGFYNDLKNGDATKYDTIPLIFLFYPQWRSLKVLGSFFFYHHDEVQLNSDMTKFDKQLGSLEPFLESSFQVIML